MVMYFNIETIVRKKFASILFVLILVFLIPLSGFAQDNQNVTDTLRKGALRLFIDCRSCDINYTREEIPYVNYVRDTREAQVYLLVTDQNAGSGGQQYTLTYEGLAEFKGMNDTLIYTSNPDETYTIVREKKTNLMKMGLMRYVAKTPVFNEIEIRNNKSLRQAEVVDKWNNWVFELQTSPRYNSEESYKRVFLSNSINITKVTPDIKLEIQLDQSTNKQTYIADSVESVYIRSRKEMEFLFVKSLGEKWSAGLKWNLGASSSENYDFNTEFLPSIEYDLYPYSESTHRQLRFLYSIGYKYSNYIDTTIYNQTSESLAKQELGIAYQVQKKWGSINISLQGSNYFYDLSKNRVELFGFAQLRIIKGLSLNINGGVAYIADQLNIRKEALTEAERLLRLKEQATNFSVQGGLSLTYTFGSIYNNVVNPRFGNGNHYGGGGYY
jgi:hypothetical protein